MSPAWKVEIGDCLEVMRSMQSDSVDAMVTDPPAGISFMGKSWDSNRGSRNQWIAWLTEVMEEAHRVLKPGAHGLVWALPRTSHWTAMALEDAGFVIRERITHHFGSGFPKNLDVGKAIDKMAGAEREVVGRVAGMGRQNPEWNGTAKGRKENSFKAIYDSTAPATEAAAQWDGWGTALKPATEDWWLIRKPLSESSVARNVLEWNCGAINIDKCRVGATSGGAESSSGEANPRGCPIHGMRGVRQVDEALEVGSETGEVADDVRAGMPQRSDERGQQSQLARRGLDGQANGLPSSGGGEPERRGQGATSDATTTGIPRTSASNGSSTGQAAGLERDGASRQRSQGRQPPAESTSNRLAGALAPTSRDREGIGDAALAEQAASACTCGPEPETKLNPNQGRWPANLLISHSPLCRATGGVRKVKDANRTQNGQVYGKGYHGNFYGEGEKVRYNDPDGTEQVEEYICVPECPVRLLDEQSGQSKSSGGRIGNKDGGGIYGGGKGLAGAYEKGDPGFGDTGGASRFFQRFEPDVGDGFKYAAKASRRDRSANGTVENKHPTCKPTSLLRYLVRLVTPPGGTVLDCFGGSGTTAVACILEGFDCILIEQDPEYAAVARARAEWAEGQLEAPNGKPQLSKRLEDSSAPTTLF